MNWCKLDEKNSASDLVGRKAWTLAKLHSIGFNEVLDGIVITTDFTSNLHDEKSSNRKSIYNLLDEIRPKETLASKKLIARSSSTLEDSRKATLAGIYESIGPIGTTDELVDAILQITSPVESEILEAFGLNDAILSQRIAVLIQPYIFIDALFTVSTCHQDNGVIGTFIEKSVNDEIINGYFIPSKESTGSFPVSSNESDISLLNRVLIMSKNVCKYISDELYLEIGLSGDDLILFQARHIPLG